MRPTKIDRCSCSTFQPAPTRLGRTLLEALPARCGLAYQPVMALISCAAAATFCAAAAADDAPLVRVVELNIGESQSVQLHDGKEATIKLLQVTEQRDSVMKAIRQVEVQLEVNGQRGSLVSGLYRLPQPIGGIQIDCPVTANYNKDTHVNHWGLEKQARFRLWPLDSPWIRPGTFVYPVGQKWFASQTWFSNEAVSQRPDGQFYYHAGLDLGGCELLVPVFAATAGRVVSVAGHAEEGLPASAVKPRYDVVYLQDKRGWYYRYSHLSSIATPIRLGAEVQLGQPLGTIGKEGGSGGWSHLHFEIKSLQPSGFWGTQEGYAFLWQANRAQHDPEIIAVARPRHLALTGETVTLDGSRSWSKNEIVRYHWTLSNNKTASGKTVQRKYSQPGTYNEQLTVTDSQGNSAIDFAIVKVIDRANPERVTPGIHATYHPSLAVRAGDPVTFKVRARYVVEGYDVWNFGDGQPEVTVRSNRDPSTHAQVGYAATVHRFARPGRYVVSVRRQSSAGAAEDRLVLDVE